jgi:hypothetical protein
MPSSTIPTDTPATTHSASSSTHPPLIRRRTLFVFFFVFFAWLAAAITVASTGALAQMPRPAIPLMIWSPVILALAFYRRSRNLRAYLATIDMRVPIFLHVIRTFFGVAFLVLLSRGTLPAAFARPAGWGDIVVGLLAIPAGIAAGGTWNHRRRFVLAWNVLGFADILMAFVSAQRRSSSSVIRAWWERSGTCRSRWCRWSLCPWFS